jgi:hypothetical protein
MDKNRRKNTMINVYATSDLLKFEIAKSILSGSGIKFIVSGERLQDIIGAGRIGGFNILTGPAQLAVPDDQAKSARELLADLLDDNQAQ